MCMKKAISRTSTDFRYFNSKKMGNSFIVSKITKEHILFKE